ncbi:hypothetical protein QZH41_019405, partial [Actinostola sp. cb2023]
CSLTYIDFEGRSDGESIKRILTLVNPRKLILIHGDSESTEHLAEYCLTNTSIQVSQVFIPLPGETVEATGERHIYQVKLRDALVSSLQFSRARDAELAWLDGQLHMEESESHLGLLQEEEKMETEVEVKDALDTVPVLEQVSTSKVTGHVSVYSSTSLDCQTLNKFLNKAGIQAEFAGGVLICNNVVCVRR